MSVDLDLLANHPLFANLDRGQLEKFLGAFEESPVKAGHVLFEKGSTPSSLLIVATGSVEMRADDPALQKEKDTPLRISGPAPVGELAALASWDRDVTAVMATDGVLLTFPMDQLRAFFVEHGAIGVAFHQGLAHVAVRKIARDAKRMREMRENLMTTQRAMKRMREALLDADDTPLHAMLFEELDTNIEANRRGHYLVEPTRLLRTMVRCDNGTEAAITSLSNEWIQFTKEAAPNAQVGEDWSGVLLLEDAEVPVSGTVDRVTDTSVVIFMDELIEQSDALLEKHLGRLQMLDVVL